MKDLICFTIFLYALSILYKTGNVFALYIISAIVIIYIIKYNRLENAISIFKRKHKKVVNEELTKQKEYFNEILTHDIKVPTLAQLRGLELLRKEIVGNINSDQRELIENIENSCKYILDMIAMMQNTYKIESGQNKLCYEKFCLSKLLIDCLNEMNSTMQEKNISIAYFASEQNVSVEADFQGIRSVILNLLAFAISYSNHNEKILINISSHNDNIKFLIKTNGIYLSQECCDKIFDQENSDPLQYTVIGQNISLYLCKKIIEEHSGKIYATSDETKSMSLVFTLPKEKLSNSINYLCTKSY